MKLFFRIVLILVTIAYPFVVYFGLKHLDVSFFVLFLLGIAALRWFIPGTQMGPRWLWAGLLIIVALGVWVFERTEGLKIYPVLVNLSFLALFTHSLRSPPTIIERMARMTEPDLPESGVRYTRAVTRLWIGFFIFNGCVALGTAVWASDEVWILYNGVVAYLLMGVLFAGEWLVRGWFRSKHA